MTGRTHGSRHSRRPGRHSPSGLAARWQQPDALLFDAAAAVALFVVPFAVGGRHPLGYAALSIAAGLACLAWLIRILRDDEPRWTLGLGEAFLAAGLVIGGVQLVAFSPTTINTLSRPLEKYSALKWP